MRATVRASAPMRACAALAACAACCAAAPEAARAHGLVGRTDLPIPLWLFAWAAAIVMVVSFVALGSLWRRPRLQAPRALRPLARAPRLAEPLCGLAGVALFALVIYSGLEGTPVGTANLAPTFIYVIFWVGLPLLSVICGDVFRLFNPWRAVARAGAALARAARRGRAPAPLLGGYPAWLGRWPAIAGLLGFAWLELVYDNRDDPQTLALLALAYGAIQLAGMALTGIEAWSARGDAFGSYFGLMARLSPFERRDGRICWRTPLSGVTDLELAPGTVALLCVLIGTTTFDGFTNAGLWAELAPSLERPFTAAGLGVTAAAQLAYTIGLALCVLLVGAFYRFAIRGMRSVTGAAGTRGLAGRFAHSLTPIVLAYVLAHYFSLLVLQGQAIVRLASDPLGSGADLLGSADFEVNWTLVSASAIWYVQVAALVVGHVCGLILAHDRAIADFRSPQDALRSQYWMLVVMVGFTCLALWLLSAVAT